MQLLLHLELAKIELLYFLYLLPILTVLMMSCIIKMSVSIENNRIRDNTYETPLCLKIFRLLMEKLRDSSRMNRRSHNFDMLFGYSNPSTLYVSPSGSVGMSPNKSTESSSSSRVTISSACLSTSDTRL